MDYDQLWLQNLVITSTSDHSTVCYNNFNTIVESYKSQNTDRGTNIMVKTYGFDHMKEYLALEPAVWLYYRSYMT